MTTSNCVLLMADFMATGIWVDMYPAELDSIPMPYWLSRMIYEWQALYDRTGFDDGFDDIDFDRQGRALAVKLKQNLPEGWRVSFYAESINKTESITLE